MNNPILTNNDLIIASRINSRSYQFCELEALIVHAEKQKERMASSYAHWCSVLTTLKGELASGLLEIEDAELARKPAVSAERSLRYLHHMRDKSYG